MQTDMKRWGQGCAKYYWPGDSVPHHVMNETFLLILGMSKLASGIVMGELTIAGIYKNSEGRPLASVVICKILSVVEIDTESRTFASWYMV